jgi:hypothetical protein|nr:MAG TPA_asm: hypothetical protein [Caudoviricetes sp.]
MKVTENDIKKLENELKNESNGKRRAFLKATINRYRKAMGNGAKYNTYE